jgi:tRNA pseudouridine38-40 synthase
MVRNIVGTLVEVGLGERPVEGFKSLVEACDRRRAGPTAPAQGLFLTDVQYDA